MAASFQGLGAQLAEWYLAAERDLDGRAFSYQSEIVNLTSEI